MSGHLGRMSYQEVLKRSFGRKTRQGFLPGSLGRMGRQEVSAGSLDTIADIGDSRRFWEILEDRDHRRSWEIHTENFFCALGLE